MWFALFLALVLVPWIWSATKALGVAAVVGLIALWNAELVQLPGGTRPLRPLVLDASPAPKAQWREGVPQRVLDFARLIVRDFIATWYTVLVHQRKGEEDTVFPDTVTTLLAHTLTSALDRLRSIDVTALVMLRVVPVLKEHLELYERAESVMYGNSQLASDAGYDELFLAAKYNDGKLHPAVGNVASMDTRESERAHLRLLAAQILDACLPPGPELGATGRVFVREILACAVLHPVIGLLSEPDWINQLISRKATATMQEQERVERLREALDDRRSLDQFLSHSQETPAAKRSHGAQSQRKRRAGVSTSRNQKRATGAKLHVEKFEEFLAQIESTTSIMEARHMRTSIVLQIQRTNKRMSLHPERTDGHTKEYLHMLRQALTLVDEHIVALSKTRTEAAPQIQLRTPDMDKGARADASLKDMLTNPSSLSYFMEFMERRGRALFVHFWVTVNSFKNPLEEADLDMAEVVGPSALASSDNEHVVDEQRSAEARSLKETMQILLHQFYDSPLLEVRAKYIDVARRFVDALDAERATPDQIHMVRQSALLAQHDALQLMLENDWESFLSSNLYIQAMDQLANESAFQVVDAAHPDQDPDEQMDADLLGDLETRSRDSSPDGVRAERPAMPKDDRIPLRYGFLMGGGDGSKSDSLFGQRKPLFDHDPLFNDDAQGWTSDYGIGPAMQPLAETEEASPELYPVDMHPIWPEPEEPLAKAMPDKKDRYRIAGERLLELEQIAERLQKHEELLVMLTHKAELSGANSGELRLLSVSSRSVQRDLRAATWEIQYLEQLRRECRHFFDARNAIVHATIRETEIHLDEDQRQYILYHILVRIRKEDAEEETWVVLRRYSEFRTLHQCLKRKFRQVWPLESIFPGKKLVGSMSSAFVEQRRAALERYLQAVMEIQDVCLSHELRAFLSDTPDLGDGLSDANATTLIERVLEGVTGFADNLDDWVGGLRPPMFDAVVQQLLASDSLANAPGSSPSPPSVPEDLTRPSYITEPLCDFVIELFHLKDKADWLRRRAIIIVLQKLLGSTIETWLRDLTAGYMTEAVMLAYVAQLQEMMWPNGAAFQGSARPERSPSERRATLKLTNETMSKLVPALADNVLGGNRARTGARKMVAVVQNQRLNKHLIYKVLDEVRTVTDPGCT